MSAVVCAICGTRNLARRVRCVRCGELINSGTRPSSAPARGRVIIASTVVSLVVLMVAIANREAPAAVQPSAQPAVASKPARVSTPAPAKPDPGFLDAGTAGTVAYAAGDIATALERYRQAVDTNPDDSEALNNFGQVLARSGKPEEAIPYLQKAVQLNPNVWAYRFNLAHAYSRTGNWSQAAEDYRQAVALFPDDYVTHFNLGMALHKAGKEEAAVTAFQKGAELAPAEPSFHLSLGISYERLNRANEAARSYEQYLAMLPSAPDADKVKARIELLRKPV